MLLKENGCKQPVFFDVINFFFEINQLEYFDKEKTIKYIKRSFRESSRYYKNFAFTLLIVNDYGNLLMETIEKYHPFILSNISDINKFLKELKEKIEKFKNTYSNYDFEILDDGKSFPNNIFYDEVDEIEENSNFEYDMYFY